MISRSPLLALLAGTFVVALGLGVLLGRVVSRGPGAPGGAGAGRPLPRIEDAAGWVNGGRWTSDSLSGRVAALVYWSETDPGTERALAEAEAWKRAYERFGVRVLGVHTPDFAFAADTGFAARIARRMKLSFPIAVDPSYRLSVGVPGSLGRPAFVIAGDGGIAFEGDADSPARAHAALRREIMALNPEAGLGVDEEPESQLAATAGADDRFVHLGTSRVERGPLANAEPGRSHTFTAQFRFQEEGESYVPYVVGRWTPRADGATAARGGAATFVSIRFDGGHAHAVLAPPASGPKRVWVLAGDGWVPRGMAGADVRFQAGGASYVEVTEPRLYSLMNAAGPSVLRISPEAPGITVHAIVFERGPAP